jgi:hypothetical protein
VRPREVWYAGDVPTEAPPLPPAGASPLALTGFLPAWDIERRRADVGVPEIPPVPARAWAVLLFTPLHLHCAKPPSGDTCRVSADIRIVPRPSVTPDPTFSALESEP